MLDLRAVPSPRSIFRLLLVVGLGGCGSRTPLDVDAMNACSESGASRACSDECGEGSQTCADGVWSTCSVPVAKRTCTNDCGLGEQTCSVGAWSACSVAVATRECRTICGSGQESCRDGKWADCSAPRPGPPKLKVIVRDFNDTHPDFERSGGSSAIDTAIVQKVLGSDDKPVYAGMPSTISTTGKQFFDEWYRDTPGVNLSTAITISLTPSASNPNVFNYDNDAFFPIDGKLFGNQARPHNYDFTVELSTQFRYVGGETFRFTGDDDLFVFVNRNLAINLGGTHQAASGAVDLDAQAMALGLVKGNIYPFHLFFAERHVVSSTFHIQTSITEFASCD